MNGYNFWNNLNLIPKKEKYSLNNSYILNTIQLLIKENPNDSDLGRKIRKLLYVNK